MKHQKVAYQIVILTLLVAASIAINLPHGTGQLIPIGNQSFVYSVGESFVVQDLVNQLTLTFTVSSGSLNAVGSIYADSNGGTLTLTSTTTGTLTITANGTIVYLFVNSVANSGTYSYTTSPFTITWQFTPQPTSTPIIINQQGSQNHTYYLRSDSQTTNTISAYALATTNTQITSTLSDTASGTSVTWGFRVFIIHYNGAASELTSGTPTATMTRSSTGAGYQTSTWTPPYTTLDLGYDALEVCVYEKIDSGAWLLKGSYLTASLMYKAILLQTWTFSLYTNATVSGGTITAAYSFGSSTAASAIDYVGFTNPNQWDLQTLAMNQGDWIAFILGPYYAEIGSAAYLLILLIPTATLYMRYRSFAPVVFLFILFGSSGGLIWLFIPAWAAAVVDAFILLGFSFIVWRLIR